MKKGEAKMRKILLLLGAAVLLTGCAKDWNPFRSVIIDWVDFVKLDGRMYEAFYGVVLADPDLVAEPIGEVRFNVSENVTNPGYKTKDGDAAFLKKGTKLYAIDGLNPENYLAAPDASAIGGYKVYCHAAERGACWRGVYEQIPTGAARIEVYRGYEGTERSAVHEGAAVEAILELLRNSEPREDYQPKTSEGDPAMYRLVFHKGGPLAQLHGIFRDDYTYYWHPSGLRLLDSAIGEYLGEET
jgi:hypothetical protein